MKTKKEQRTFGIIVCDAYNRLGKGRRVIEYRGVSLIDVDYDVDVTEWANYKNTYEEYSTLKAAKAAL